MAEIRSEALKADIETTRRRISETLRSLEVRAEAVVSPRPDVNRIDQAGRAFHVAATASAAYSAFKATRSIRSVALRRALVGMGVLYTIHRVSLPWR